MSALQCHACGYPMHTSIHHACDKCRAEAEQKEALTELLATAKDMARMLDAVRYTAGLGTRQLERLKKAQAVITRAEKVLGR